LGNFLLFNLSWDAVKHAWNNPVTYLYEVRLTNIGSSDQPTDPVSKRLSEPGNFMGFML